ncbi:extracellular solute-binding protein [Paenibacillus turpanensis]|uniref:extracellular solute-binding protein n=1 Tax=Paenibacillus turpanensis TaxID=2689078 RepID=UPI001409DB6F|nr:extracellular solute-binding protein [Paenibacillus turpanensis]
MNSVHQAKREIAGGRGNKGRGLLGWGGLRFYSVKSKPDERWRAGRAGRAVTEPASVSRRGATLLSLVVAAALVSAGCVSESSKAPAQEPKTNQSSDAAKDISMMLILYSEQPPSDLIERTLEEKTGTQLTLNWVPDNVYSDKQMSSFAAGRLPKVIQVKSVDLGKPTIVNAVRSGLFWEIGPYLKEFPHISKFMNRTIMDNGAYFGKYYGLYWELPMSRQGIQYRKDWLLNLGLQEPKTIEDLYRVLKAFTYEDPDRNGKHDTYGLVDRNDLVYGAFKNIASYFGTPNNWGLQDGALVPDFMTPEYREAMKFMKRLYNEKLINPDFSVISKIQQEERFAAGEAGMMISNLLASSTIERIKKLHPNAEVDILNRISGPTGDHIWGGTGLGGLYLFPKTSIKTEEELRSVLWFFDQLLTEDMNNLITYGIEGRHYVRTPDGAAKVTPDTRELREQETEDYNTAFRTFDIRYLKQGSINEMQQKIIRLIADNQMIVVHDPAAGLNPPTRAEKGAELGAIITEATYHFILGTIDEEGFTRQVEKWRASGGDQMIAEMNEAYQEAKRN